MRDKGPPAVLLLGAGDRGRVYTDWLLRHPGRMRVAAVAEPDEKRREYIRTRHRLSPERCFADWQDALAADLPVDAVIVATQDRMHVQPATRALELGLHVLLEKPMAPTREEVLAIAAAEAHGSGQGRAPAAGPSLTVCHVLRYSSFFQAVRRVLVSGELGEVQSIFLAENVAYYHFAHSFVRGNWANSSTSSPLILAKSCHDLDILCWLAGAPPERVYSAAGVSFFTARNAPVGAPARCADGCPAAGSCLYEAEQTYVRGIPLKRALAAGAGPIAWAARLGANRPRLAAALPWLRRYAVWKEWPTTAVTSDLTQTGIRAALESGPYGRCVFRCDNDQPDHQDTVITFANGITATFRLHGRSHAEGRTFRVDGSRGTLRGRFGSGTVLELHRHGAGAPLRISVTGDLLGHSQADGALMDAWTAMVAGRAGGDAAAGVPQDGAAAPRAAGESGFPAQVETSAAASVASHLLAFAAHESAMTGEAQPVFIPSADGRL